MPPLEIIRKGTRSHKYFNVDGSFKFGEKRKSTVKGPNTKGIQEFLNSTDHEFIQLIQACLQWDPQIRITSENAMKSRWYINDTRITESNQPRKCKIRIEDIIKNAPQLKKYYTQHKNNEAK